MAASTMAAGRKAIKVIACWSHNLADTKEDLSRSFSKQLHAPVVQEVDAQKWDFARGVLWNLRESGGAVGKASKILDSNAGFLQESLSRFVGEMEKAQKS